LVHHDDDHDHHHDNDHDHGHNDAREDKQDKQRQADNSNGQTVLEAASLDFQLRP
jgi:hypothetical protein